MAFTTLQSVAHRGTSIVTASDVALNDSSKTLLLTDFTGGAFFELLGIRIEITATATVGTRLMEVRIEATTGPDVLYEVIVVANTVVASASGEWQLAPGLDETQTGPQYVQMPPGLHVYAGQQLVIEDQAAIDAAADDMIVHVTGKLFGVRSL